MSPSTVTSHPLIPTPVIISPQRLLQDGHEERSQELDAPRRGSVHFDDLRSDVKVTRLALRGKHLREKGTEGTEEGLRRGEQGGWSSEVRVWAERGW